MEDEKRKKLSGHYKSSNGFRKNALLFLERRCLPGSSNMKKVVSARLLDSIANGRGDAQATEEGLGSGEDTGVARCLRSCA